MGGRMPTSGARSERARAARSSAAVPRPFSQAPWLRGAHAQTIVPSLFRTPPRVDAVRHRIDLPDGDFLDVDLALPEGSPLGFCVIVHGLEGSSESVYVRGTAHCAIRRGLVAVALNQRGCSGEPNRLPGAYHAGLTDDLRSVIDWTQGRFPGLRGTVIGFSLGANQTLKMLGEDGDGARPSIACAVAISPPFDLHAVADRLDSTAGLLYRLRFLRTLVTKAFRSARRHAVAPRPSEVLGVGFQLRAFDHLVTAPLHGFASAEDYYDRAICTPFLSGIRRPTLILASRDDPIIPGATIPELAIRENPFLQLHVTEHGGHVGFVSGPFRKPRYWAEQQAVLWSVRTLAARAAGAAAPPVSEEAVS